jgi:hypothetical protein
LTSVMRGGGEGVEGGVRGPTSPWTPLFGDAGRLGT